MKSVLLLLIILCIVLGITLPGKVIQIQVVIPPRLLPYYQWLISFPGLNSNPEEQIQENQPLYHTSEA